MMTRLKVSFDFDGTLSKFGIQEFAKDLIAQGIQTSRYLNRSYTE
jgi:phosphoserine phosphatase